MSSVRNKNGIWINTECFREEANKFIKEGRYCDHAMGSYGYYEYWNEQLRRCREGYDSGGVHIPGDMYHYLNFCQIKLVDTRTGENVTKKKTSTKVVTFPDFWDGDFEYYTALEKAEKEGKHFIVLKRRRGGFSFKNGGKAANKYNTVRFSYTLLAAYDKKYLFPSGIFTMALSYLNFLNEHTAFGKRRQVVNKQDHIKASYLEYQEDGTQVEKGYQSQIQAISFKDNPDAGRGKDANLIIFEEAGTFSNLKETYWAMRPSVEQGDIVTGQMILFGTGGDIIGGADFEDMFYDPETYNLAAFDNIYDEDLQGTTCGFFFSEIQNRGGFIDKVGNSLKKEALASELAVRKHLIESSKDASSIDNHVVEHPLKPREAFLKVSTNLFPVVEIDRWYGKIKTDRTLSGMGMHGILMNTEKGVNFKISDKARPLTEYRIKPGKDKSGCVTVYQEPFKDVVGVPSGLYIIVHDPYAHEEATASVSIGASYVIKLINNFSKPDDLIVASYVGRPDSQDEYNRNLFMLAEYYNAKIAFENDMGDVYGYAKRFKKLQYLMPELEIINPKEGMVIRKLGRKYGMSINAKGRRAQGALYLRDWLNTKRGLNEDNQHTTNLNFIYDTALLEELKNYSSEGNFDRVSALIVGMYYMSDIMSKKVYKDDQEVEEEKNNFFNRAIFV